MVAHIFQGLEQQGVFPRAFLDTLFSIPAFYGRERPWLRGILGRALAQWHMVTSAATKGHPVERTLRHPGGSSDVGCCVVAAHCGCRENSVADSLFRSQFCRFQTLPPEADLDPTHIPALVIHT